MNSATAPCCCRGNRIRRSAHMTPVNVRVIQSAHADSPAHLRSGRRQTCCHPAPVRDGHHLRRAGGPRQPAGARLPPGRPARGRHRRDPHGEQRAHPRGHVGGAPQRSVLRADQHPPDRGRGRLHRRQQRRQGDHRLGGTARDLRASGRTPAGRAARPADDRVADADAISTAGSATRNVLRINRTPRSTTNSRATCCSTRREPPAGPRESDANCRTSHRPRRPA